MYISAYPHVSIPLVRNVQQQLSALLKASEVVTLPSESATQPAADKDKVQDDPPVSGADSMELDVADGQAVDIQPDKDPS